MKTKQKKIPTFQHNYLSALLIRLGIVLVIYSISRVLFLIFNADFLLQTTEPLGWKYWIYLFLGGIRFDLLSLTVINSLFIVASLLPFHFRESSPYRKLTTIILYYIPNIIAFAADYIDIIYSRFTQKRMTFDVFRFVKTENGFIDLIPQFFTDYWYIFLIFIGMMFLFIFINNRIKIKPPKTEKSEINFYIKNSLIFILSILICAVTSRGGLQPRPLSIISASQYAIPEHYSLVLNTPFTLIKTVNKSGIERKNYFSEKELKEIYQPIYFPDSNKPFHPENVVVIILEGISSEYSSILNSSIQRSFTPFLDSLGKEGIIMPAFANGTRSMEGVPAIIAGIPTLMDNEYITSNYSENQMTALPLLLKEEGYTSAFFHGGNTGTMNFNYFTKMAGFDYYHGRTEYNNDKDYDGSWGIYDDRFLEYCAKQLDNLPQPFFSSIFTLSSHHPYSLPKYYQEEFKISNFNMGNSVQYVDWALRKFFQEASQKDWYKNTLFIISSDHAYQPNDLSNKNRYSQYAIPLIIFHPDYEYSEVRKEFAQQIDILPSILDLLDFQSPTFAFGKSIFREGQSFAINYRQDSYQIITNDYVLIFNGETITELYKRNDSFSLLKSNLINEQSTPLKEFDFLKAFIQVYNNSLLDNKLTLSRYLNENK